jgi:hypothetical protein
MAHRFRSTEKNTETKEGEGTGECRMLLILELNLFCSLKIVERDEMDGAYEKCRQNLVN